MPDIKPNVPEYRKRPAALSRWLQRWPFLVWLGMALLTLTLYYHGGNFRPLNGLVVVVRENIACMETAPLKRVHVVPGQQVQAGELLAEMDTVLIDEQIAALRQDILMETAERERSFSNSIQSIRNSLTQIQVEQSRDQTAYEELQSRTQNLRKLLEQGLITDKEYADHRMSMAGIQTMLQNYPAMIAQHESDLERMIQLKKAIDSQGARDLDSLDKRIEALMVVRESYFLRANSPGSVALIAFQPGEIVPAATPVVQLVKQTEAQFETFIPETFAYAITLGQTFMVSSVTNPAAPPVRAVIVSATPNILGQQDKAYLMAKRVVRGRRILLSPLEPCSFLPGESVMIEVERQGLVQSALSLFSEAEPQTAPLP